MTEQRTFKEIIKVWRKEHRYTQSDVSKLFGFSVNMYSLWERGEKIPSAKRYLDISKITGYSLDDITNACRVSEEKRLAAKESRKYNLRANPSIAKTIQNKAVINPVVVDTPKAEPMPMAEFDNLLKKYTEKINEQAKVRTEWLSLNDKLERIKLELVEIRDEIRRNA